LWHALERAPDGRVVELEQGKRKSDDETLVAAANRLELEEKSSSVSHTRSLSNDAAACSLMYARHCPSVYCDEWYEAIIVETCAVTAGSDDIVGRLA